MAKNRLSTFNAGVDSAREASAMAKTKCQGGDILSNWIFRCFYTALAAKTRVVYSRNAHSSCGRDSFLPKYFLHLFLYLLRKAISGYCSATG